MHAFILAGGGKLPAIRAECHRIDRPAVAGKGGEVVPAEFGPVVPLEARRSMPLVRSGLCPASRCACGPSGFAPRRAGPGACRRRTGVLGGELLFLGQLAIVSASRARSFARRTKCNETTVPASSSTATAAVKPATTGLRRHQRQTSPWDPPAWAWIRLVLQETAQVVRQVRGRGVALLLGPSEGI